MPDWLMDDAVRSLNNSLKIAAMLPRAIRVRRRGFSPNVKRGDVVRHAGKRWEVARRSNHNLWLYEFPEITGSTISVRVPKRFTVN